MASEIVNAETSLKADLVKKEPKQKSANATSSSIQSVPPHAESSSTGQDAKGAADPAWTPAEWLVNIWHNDNIKKAIEKIWTEESKGRKVQSFMKGINQQISGTCLKHGDDPDKGMIPWLEIEHHRDIALSILSKLNKGKFQKDTDGFKEYDRVVLELETFLGNHQFPVS